MHSGIEDPYSLDAQLFNDAKYLIFGAIEGPFSDYKQAYTMYAASAWRPEKFKKVFPHITELLEKENDGSHVMASDILERYRNAS